MMWHRILIWSGAGCVAWGLMGCTVKNIDPNSNGSANGDNGAPASVALRGATVPSSFNFATSRGVQLTLTADKSLFNAKGVAAVEVTNTAHALLFQGPIRVGQPLLVQLSVPTKDDLVNVTFRTQGVEQNSSTPIVNNAASHIFQ
jgi:hypothetical protein